MMVGEVIILAKSLISSLLQSFCHHDNDDVDGKEDDDTRFEHLPVQRRESEKFMNIVKCPLTRK